MKKTLLSLGTIVSTIAPVVSVIACGDGDVPGHEAPYIITIDADAVTPTQANVVIKLRGYVSDSYIKEIKSRIAEDIARLNKDALKYSTLTITLRNITNPFSADSFVKTIASQLTETNKNNLEEIHNFLDSDFDDLINRAKTYDDPINLNILKQYFKKDIWQNQHHQIDKVNKDEIKTKILELFRYSKTDPDLIDFEYEWISDKYINFTITRTDVVSTPEISSSMLSLNTSFQQFVPGEKINVNINFNSMTSESSKDFIIDNDVKVCAYNSKIPTKNNFVGIHTARGSINPHGQVFKILKFLLKMNGYDNDKVMIFKSKNNASIETHIVDELKTSANSKSKVFTYGDNGQLPGINSFDGGARYRPRREFQIDFEKKTFKIKLSAKPHNEKQWIFGEDGHLVIEPTKEWTMEFEGTYELNVAGDTVETITSLTKETATDGTHTIHLLESSAKKMTKILINETNLLEGGW